MADSKVGSRALALIGFAVVIANGLGVAFLVDVPHAYRIEHLEEWANEAIFHIPAHSASALFFALGLALMPAFVAGASRRFGPARPIASIGSALLSLGAGLNAFGCVMLLLRFGSPEAQGSVDAVGPTLQIAQYLDAAFNFLLGVGLILICLGTASLPKGLQRLGLAAGALSIPVTLQAVSDTFASLVLLSGPLWLLWFAATSVVLFRRR